MRSIQRIGDTSKLFIEIPQIQPVNQLHLHHNGKNKIELFATIHELGKPFKDFNDYKKIKKIFGIDSQIVASDTDDPNILISACTACHHMKDQIVGPSLEFIKTKYAENPKGIVDWAISPQKNNPQLPPMPSFSFLGEKRLKIIADKMLE